MTKHPLRSLAFWLVALAPAMVVSTACRTPRDVQPASDTLDLAAVNSREASNIMVLSGARVLKDTEKAAYRDLLPRVKAVFEELSGSGKFTVEEPRYEVTKQQILDDLENAARGVGRDGTLLWYISSHGQAGKLRSYDAKTLEAKDLIDAIRRGRTFDGKVVQLRRLYMFFDYCNAGVSVNAFEAALPEVSRAATVKPVDLGAARGLDSDTAQFVAAFNNASAASADANSGLALSEDGATHANGKEGLFQEALIFSSTSVDQYTFHMAFIDAVKGALRELKTSSSVTIGEFLQKVTEKTALVQQENSATHEKGPQRTYYLALPDNGLLGEPLYGALASRWKNNGEPCPPWNEVQWNYARSRDALGQCIQGKNYCSCFSSKAQDSSRVCAFNIPGALKIWSKPSDLQAEGASGACYKTCDQIALEHKDEFLKRCDGKVVMQNPANRLELIELTPFLLYNRTR